MTFDVNSYCSEFKGSCEKQGEGGSGELKDKQSAHK